MLSRSATSVSYGNGVHSLVAERLSEHATVRSCAVLYSASEIISENVLFICKNILTQSLASMHNGILDVYNPSIAPILSRGYYPFIADACGYL